jgi:hypothetical protein
MTSMLSTARIQKTPALSLGSKVRLGPKGSARNAAKTGAKLK